MNKSLNQAASCKIIGYIRLDFSRIFCIRKLAAACSVTPLAVWAYSVIGA
ncbi:hypothetical protein [Paenibacillus tarimensis]|nr:hypothetical protein [Paenibacillus tarimensis]MCF2945695.1 hypothetical protein [Paenibacillus tarimensis]